VPRGSLPSQRVFDSHGYMLALQAKSSARGALVLSSPFVARGRSLMVSRFGGGDEQPISATNLVIAAGSATGLRAHLDRFRSEHSCAALWQGNYFTLRARPAVSSD